MQKFVKYKNRNSIASSNIDWCNQYISISIRNIELQPSAL